VSIFCGGFFYGFAFLFVLIGPSEPAVSASELVINALSLAATAVMAVLLYVITAIYVVSFVLD